MIVIIFFIYKCRASQIAINFMVTSYTNTGRLVMLFPLLWHLHQGQNSRKQWIVRAPSRRLGHAPCKKHAYHYLPNCMLIFLRTIVVCQDIGSLRRLFFIFIFYFFYFPVLFDFVFLEGFGLVLPLVYTFLRF